MSVSIKYKNNEILSIPSSGDYKLNTSGKYLEDDIRITATGGGSAAVVVTEEQLPGGGIAKHINAVDISDTTAVAADVAQGKYFYTADGTKTQGTSSGGTPTPPAPPAPWVRPSDWPDLSQMDVSGGDIIYMTSYADEARGFCSFYVTCTGSYTVEVGNISGSTFTAESTQTYASGDDCILYYGSANGTYKVLRVTGNTITSFSLKGDYGIITIGNFNGFSRNNGIIDVVGKLPSCSTMIHAYNYNLISMDISNVVLVGNISGMFRDCYSLVSLDTSSWDTSSVTNMGAMFQSCYSLAHLDVSGFNTSLVTSMTSMFSYCSSLAYLDVSGFDTSQVAGMSSMFSYCYSLTYLDVSDWDTSSATNMSNMFSYCTSLAYLDVSGFNTSKVTSISAMFSYCYSLTYLDVSGFNTSKVTTMSGMFNSCTSLASLDVSGFNTSLVTSMNSMFNYCYSLTSLDVSGFNTSLVTSMGSMFQNCYSLTSLDVSGFNTSLVTSMSYMFSYCYSLTYLDVSGFNTSKVTNMSNMFYYCRDLTSLDVSGFNTSLVTNMSYMFNNCTSLTSLDVSDWDTSSATNMSNMFNSCHSLAYLDVSGFNFIKVTSSSNTQAMFSFCYGLYKSITIPSSITQIGANFLGSTRSIQEYHFLSTTPPTLANTSAFSNMTDFGGKKIYVPVGSLNAYKTATNWSTYADYIEEEPA